MNNWRLRISHHIFKWFRPVMVGRFKRYDGVRLERTRISNTTTILGYNTFYVEDNVFIGHYNFIDASNKLRIEEGCQVTNYVSILTHSSHQAIRLYGKKYGLLGKMKAYNEGEVSIGKYSFIGPHSCIMPSTKIGKGSLIAAYSYVKGVFPDYAIIAGNPAKVIGDTREQDEALLLANPELKSYYNDWSQ
jgi:acetyltransferase-like isoleucine patch superfamily enzyme